MTGAKYEVMTGDAEEVERGRKSNFAYGSSKSMSYKPAKVDRVLYDGDKVILGGTTLVAHLTPGHTKGCTTWTVKLRDRGRTLNAVIVGSPNVNPGYKLVDNKQYPNIAADYRKGFKVLRSLPCDLFLGAHGSYFGMLGKLKRGKRDLFATRLATQPLSRSTARALSENWQSSGGRRIRNPKTGSVLLTSMGYRNPTI